MAQIEYDESGATFSYFLLSAYVFLLIPVTYLLWPSSGDAKSGTGQQWHVKLTLYLTQRISLRVVGLVSVRGVFVNYIRRTQRDHVRNGGRELGESMHVIYCVFRGM